MKNLSFFLLILGCFLCKAQKNCGIVYGDLTALLGQSSITIKVDYDSLKVVGYGNESDFVSQVKQKFEEDKKGEGDKWEESWKHRRTNVFPRRFKTLFHKHSGLDSLASEFCLVLRPTKLHSGFKSEDETPFAYLSGEVYLIRISEPNKTLAKLMFWNVRGEGVVADPTGGLRIGDTYAIAGRTIGKFIKDSVKKSKKRTE